MAAKIHSTAIVESGAELGTEVEIGKLDGETSESLIVKAASEAGKVGITGFCLGGTISWRAARSCKGAPKADKALLDTSARW